MTIALMICFARSGGTILNQCLGSIPNVVMLSEVNPLGGGSGKEQSYKTVKDQANNWYQIELDSDDFTEGVLELEAVCQARNFDLIVRDWSFANFMPIEENQNNPPEKLLTLEALENRTTLKTFAFVRDAIDVWISRGTPPVEDFFPQYLKYIKTVVSCDIPIFKYEDFCKNPNKVIQDICNFSNINRQKLEQEYLDFEKVNGDIQLQSRGRKQKIIKPLPRQLIAKAKITELNQCQAMIEANKILGYPTFYQSVKRESLVNKVVKHISFKTKSTWQNLFYTNNYFSSKS